MHNLFPSSTSDFSEEEYIKYPWIRWSQNEDAFVTHSGTVSSFDDDRSGLISEQTKFPPNFYARPGEIDNDISESIVILQEATKVHENYFNYLRLEGFETNFSHELMDMLAEDDFEYGIKSKVDRFIQDRMRENALAIRTWLNHIFVANFGNVPILLGLLRIIARLDYYTIYPEGQTMAIAALSHTNLEVRECGVRAFENWETLESLHVLQNLQGNSPWLQEYIDDVVDGLRKKYHVMA